MRVVLIFLIALCLAGCARNGHFVNGTLVISDGSRRIYIPEMCPPDDEAPTPPLVHAVHKRKGTYFVVVSTSWFTRGYPPRGGPCGSGSESYLTWLHIVDGKVSDRTDAHFESCSDNREGQIGRWQGPILKVVTTNLLEDVHAAGKNNFWQTITFTFDARHPEKGLKEEKLPSSAEPSRKL